MFEVGDKVENLGDIGSVVKIKSPESTYPVIVHHKNGDVKSYTICGREYIGDVVTLCKIEEEEECKEEYKEEEEDLKVLAGGRIYLFSNSNKDLILSFLDKLCYTSEDF